MSDPYPTVSLPSNAPLSAAFSHAADTFDQAGFEVHRHDTFNMLGDAGKTFSYHDDDKNDTFIVHVGPWTPEHITEVEQYVKGLFEMGGFFPCTGVQIFSTHPLPEELSRFAQLQDSF